MIDAAYAYLSDPDTARLRHPIDVESAASTMDLMAWLAVNPSVVNVMLAARARKVVDLQARSGRLLADILVRLPDCVGTGLISTVVSREAAYAAAHAANVHDRLTLLESHIRTLRYDSSILSGSDVVYAGSAFRELLPDHDELSEALAACSSELRPAGILLLTEVVAPPHEEDERMFGALMHLYADFGGHHLLSEKQWRDVLNSVGFTTVEVRPLGLPATRLIVARV